MSFYVGALLFLGVGVALGSWYFDAHRRWLDALASRGELPVGGTELLARGWTRPREASATLIGIARQAYPRSTRSLHGDVELWRFRRRRRLLVFVAWILAGGPIAVATTVAIDAADSLWWLLVLVPLSVVVAVCGFAIRRFGESEPNAPPSQ